MRTFRVDPITVSKQYVWINQALKTLSISSTFVYMVLLFILREYSNTRASQILVLKLGKGPYGGLHGESPRLS